LIRGCQREPIEKTNFLQEIDSPGRPEDGLGWRLLAEAMPETLTSEMIAELRCMTLRMRLGEDLIKQEPDDDMSILIEIESLDGWLSSLFASKTTVH
jgi:hypothetical protein